MSSKTDRIRLTTNDWAIVKKALKRERASLLPKKGYAIPREDKERIDIIHRLDDIIFVIEKAGV